MSDLSENMSALDIAFDARLFETGTGSGRTGSRRDLFDSGTWSGRTGSRRDLYDMNMGGSSRRDINRFS